MSKAKRRAVNSAEVIEVIKTTCVIGEGTREDPVRYLAQYWSLKGEILASYDDWTDENLVNVPTHALIEELNRRDLFAELGKEKRDWLTQNGFRQITKYQFMDADRAMLYSLERLQNSSLAKNQKKYLVAKATQYKKNE